MFRYPLNPEFDWSGEIGLLPGTDDDLDQPGRLIAEIATATGVPVPR